MIGHSNQHLLVNIFASKQVGKTADAKIRYCLECLLIAPPGQCLGKSMTFSSDQAFGIHIPLPKPCHKPSASCIFSKGREYWNPF